MITDPSQFGGQQEGSASAAESYPIDAMPAAPALTHAARVAPFDGDNSVARRAGTKPHLFLNSGLRFSIKAAMPSF